MNLPLKDPAVGRHNARQPDVVTFEDPGAYAHSIRATALVFEDPASQALYARLRRVAPSEATVLVIGETGTGKELVARQLHRLSPRVGGPFVALNCAALPEQLAESELFGHEKGAFTGALGQKKGWFEAAQGGTLFLDEVGDLPPPLQVKLLRVLQEREISRVGSRTAIPIDVRLVAATNVNLEDAVISGRFREDLYFRLNVAQLRIPSLAERPGDILPLCEHFVGVYRSRMGLAPVMLSDEAQAVLLHYVWPGNIRELENVIHHALLVMNGNVIRPKDLNLSRLRLGGGAGRMAEPPPADGRRLPADIARPPGNGAFEDALTRLFETGGNDLFADIEARLFRCAFDYCHGNQVQTAQMLGISRNILRHRLKQYGML
jgi:sigma-54-specific transcriptional regulator